MSTLQTNGAKYSKDVCTAYNDVILDHIRAALRGLQFGSVTIVVQNGRVVQIERHEKTRLLHNH